MTKVSDTYLEPSRKSIMEFFAKKLNGFPLSILKSPKSGAFAFFNILSYVAMLSNVHRFITTFAKRHIYSF